MNKNNYCIILAGGKGRRLWPCSCDTISVFEGVRLEGREQGLEKGQKDEKIANARKMKTYGLALEMIADITGLTIDEVRDL